MVYSSEVCGQVIEWTLKRSPRLKKIHINVHPQEGVIVRAPIHLQTSKVIDVIKSQGKWLSDRIIEVSLQCPRRNYCHGDLVPFLGEEKQLRVQRGEQLPWACWADAYIDVFLPDPTADSRRETVRECLATLYRQRAREWFPPRVEGLNKCYFNQNVNKVTIKEQSSILGSCSTRGNLNFNWRLLLAPLDVVDYVVAHELAHMEEMNHSQRFWEVVARACPEYQRHRAWLRHRAGTLFI